VGFLRLSDADAYVAHLRSTAAAVAQLGTGDREVLDLLVRGHDGETIATQTKQSPSALEQARARIFASLGAKSLFDLLRIAFAARRAALL